MQVLYVNNDAGGFGSQVHVDEGTTIEEFFARQKGDARSQNAIIRVNREIVACDYILQDGDKVTITPTKIDGAK